MSERFSKLFTLPENLYCPGAPVMIAAGAIQKDNETGRVLGQLKLKNIQDRSIKAVKVAVSPFDTAGKPLGGPIEHQYLDLSAPRDGEFGQKSPIKLADASTRSFTVSVTEAVFTDGSVWAGTEGAWEPLAPPAPLEEVLENAELVKQYQLKYGRDCRYQTRRERDLWLCACGAVNREGERLCHHCGKDPAILSGADLSELREERDQRLAEEARRVAEAKAAAEVQAKKMKKIALIAAPILLVVIIAGALFSDYTKKSDAYSAAAALLEELEFDDAMDAFAELGDFKDSKEMAEQGVAYEKALYLIQCAEQEDKAGLSVSSKVKGEVKTEEEDEDGNKAAPAAPASAGYEGSSDDSRPSSAESSTAVKCYRKAKAILEKLNGYKDSAQKIQEVDAAIDAAILEADYQDAIALLEDQEDHPAAREAFEALGDYKDSKTYFEGFVQLKVADINVSKNEVSQQYFYNEKGLPVQIRTSKNTITYAYDNDGDVVKMDDVTYTYSADKKTVTTKGLFPDVEEVYDDSGRLIRSTDLYSSGGGNIRTYAYELNASGQVTRMTVSTVSRKTGDPYSEAVTLYEYNAKGQCTKNSRTMTYEEDRGNGPSSTSTTVYSYDADGRETGYVRESILYVYYPNIQKVNENKSHSEYSYVYNWVYAPQAEQ